MNKNFSILLLALGSCNKSAEEIRLKNKGYNSKSDNLQRGKLSNENQLPPLERSLSEDLKEINFDDIYLPDVSLQENQLPFQEVNYNDDSGIYPLMKAISIGDQEEVISLIDAGAYVNFENQYGQTPLMKATYLMDYKNDISKLGEFDNLDNSYSFVDINIINILINSGANIDAQDEDGNTALIHSIKNNNIDAAAALLDRNANYNLTNINSETPLMFSIYALHNDIYSVNSEGDDLYFNIFDLLLEKGANIDEVDLEGNSALHHAIEIESIYSIKKLIEAGANQNIKNNLGITPYNMAMSSGYQKIIDIFNDVN